MFTVTSTVKSINPIRASSGPSVDGIAEPSLQPTRGGSMQISRLLFFPIPTIPSTTQNKASTENSRGEVSIPYTGDKNKLHELHPDVVTHRVGICWVNTVASSGTHLSNTLGGVQKRGQYVAIIHEDGP